MFAIIIDSFILGRFRQPTTKIIIVSILTLIAVYYFKRYSPLAYGTDMPKTKCESLKIKDNWDIDCSKFN